MTNTTAVRVTPKERTHPSIRLLARACVDLADARLHMQKIQAGVTRALHRLEPKVLLGERFDMDCISLQGRVIIYFLRGGMACRLVGKHADWLIKNNLAIWWCPPGERIGRDDWILLGHDLPLREYMHWAECALVQAGVGV